MEDKRKSSGKSGRVLMWSVAAIAVIAAASAVGGKIMLEKTVTSSMESSGAEAGSVNVDFLGRVHMRDVTMPLEDDRTVHIASLDGRPEFLFFSGMVDATDIELDAGQTKVSVPSVKIENASLNRDFLMSIADGNGLTPAERVEKFSAERITISNIDVVQSFDGSEQKTNYSDVVVTDVVDGHIGAYSAGSMSADMSLALPDAGGPEDLGEASVSLADITGQDIDAPFLVRLYTESKTAGADNEPHQVYGPISAKNFVMDTSEAQVKYAEMHSDGFSMRLADQPLMGTIRALQAASENSDMTSEDKQQIGLQVLSLADVFAKGDLEMSGITVTVAENPDMSFSIDTLALDFDDLVAGISVDGLMIQSGADVISLKNASWSGVSFAPTIAGIRQHIEGGPDEQVPESALMPVLGTLKLSDYVVNLGSGDGSDAGFDIDEPVNFRLKDFSLALNEPFNGYPTDIQLAIDGLNLELPDNSDNKAVKLLKQAGFEAVVLSENIQAHWVKDEKQLVIDDITVSGEKMGSISLSGMLGGFNETFFSGDMRDIQAAAFGLVAHQVKLKVENDGLLAIGLKLYADENNISEEKARMTLSMLPMIATQALGEDPVVETVMDAFADFIADPKTFEIAIKAKSDAGIGFPALMQSSMDPTSMFSQIDVTATAN